MKSNAPVKHNPTILDHYAAAQSLGAFEVLLVEKGALMNSTQDRVSVVYSKLQNKNWPKLSYLLEKISHKVPKANLVVQLYDDDEKKVLEDERAIRFINLKIKLVCRFNGTQAS